MLLGSRSAALAGALAAVFACGRERPPGAVVDDAGRAVVLARPAARIVSLSPSLTELLFAIGAGDRLVGRTRWCEDPPAAARIPSVGDGLDPNIEVVVGRRPDLVVFYHTAANAPAIARLAAVGIPTLSVILDRLDDVPRAARLLGAISGTAGTADSVAAAFERDLADLRSRSGPRPLRVLLLAWDSPPIVIGSGSYLSELVTLAGGENVFGDLPQPSLPVSIEAIVARRPDAVLVVGDADPEFLGRPEWQAVAAVRGRRFVHVTGTEFGRPSVRAKRAVTQLSATLAEFRR